MEKPLPQHLIDFLEYCEVEKGLSATTTRNYARFLQRFFAWLAKEKLSDLRPSRLTEEHVSKYRLALAHSPNAVRKASAGLRQSTQMRYLIALRSLLMYFHEKNIPALPTEKIKLPKERREGSVKFLDLDQVEKLLSATETKTETKTVAGLRDRAILETLFSTGLRVAELAALERKQFAGIVNKKDFELSIVGKGGYPRTVYWSERALPWLKKYLDERGDDDQALFIRFGGPKNAPLSLSVRGIEMIVQKYAKIAGIPILASPHTIRHSFATDLLNQGADLRAVQELLGHRNVATTQIYTHVTNKRLRDVHRKFHGGRKS